MSVLSEQTYSNTPPPPHTHTHYFSVVQVDKQKEIHLHHITQPILFIYERYLENDEKVV